MAKTILPVGSYTYIPFSQQVDFSNFTSATGEVFNFSRLYAIIDVIAGQIIYTTSGTSSGYGGTYSAPTLTLSYNTTPFSGSELQIIYDLASTPSATYDGTGTQPILSSTDPITGREGLDINLLNSSFGGQLTYPLPSYTTSGYNAALSMGFINGGNLVAPAMDPMTNELIVQANFSAASTQNVNISEINGFSPSVSQGASDAGTLRVASNQYSSGGNTLDYGNGQITSTGSQRMSLGDYAFSGPASITGPLNNLITGGGTSTDLNGYRYFSIQIVCTATAGTFIFETSNDDTNWQPLAVSNQSLTTGVIITSAITATASSFIYVGTVTGRYLRIRIVTGLTGGSAQAICRFSQVAPLANNVTISSGSASTVAPNIDVLGSAVSGSRYNQIEIDFNTAPSASLLTTTVTGSGTITQSNGHSLFATSSTASSSAKGVSVGIVQYRAANELYSYFSAAFTVSGGSRTGSSYQRIGIYDTTNGFFIGYSGLNFGVTKRTGGIDTFTNRTAWNGDLLDGNPASKFTRNNIPEAIDFTKSNLFRIRFAWLGSACILFDVYSPDGIWVNYHTIKQPNIDFSPSLTVPNLPMTIDCAKNSSSTEILTIATACWAGGTSSSYSPITSTLNDNSLAALNRSVITGVTTGGGGGYVNVKVNPSGALVTDSTISGTPSVNISQFGGTATTLGQKTLGLSLPVALSTDTATGVISSLSGFVALGVTGYTAVAIDVRGTFTQTLTFQGSIDGSNFISLNAVPYGAVQNTALTPNATAAGAWVVQCAGCDTIRVVSTAYTSGSATVRVRATNATGWVYNAPVGTTNAVAVSGSLTGVTTVTTVTGVTTVSTVSSVTSAALSSALVTDVNAVSVVATGNSANIAISNQLSSSFSLLCNYTAGTGTIDVTIQESYDNGTTWVDIYAFDRVSSLGANRQNAPLMRTSNTLLRYSYVITGSVTGNAITITRTHRSTMAPAIKRIYDRTLNPTTLGSSSASLYTEGCENSDLVVNMGAGGTAPVIQLQGSEDGTNWYNVGSTLTATVGTTTSLSIADGSLPRFTRATVATAGAGSTLGYIAIKAKGSS